MSALAKSGACAVVLDLLMPERSGADVARQLRSDGFAGRTVLVTGTVDAGEAVEALLSAGIVDVVVGKPWTLEELELAVAGKPALQPE